MNSTFLKDSQFIIIGGTGQVGHCLVDQIISGGAEKVFASSVSVQSGTPQDDLAKTIAHKCLAWGSRVDWFECDLEKPDSEIRLALDSLSLEKNKNTYVVVTASYTNVDGCEVDPQKCQKINVIGTTTVLKWAKERDFRTVFYSSDYVFDGKKGMYTEDDEVNPLSVYGRSKLQIEQWCKVNDPTALILRTTGVYEYLLGSKNFVMQMLDLWKNGVQTRIPSDQYANPTWAFELARATLDLLEKQHSGIYHAAGADFMARTEFANLIAASFRIKDAKIQPILTSELKQKAKRPLKGGLNCAKAEAALGWKFSDPKVVLSRFAEQSLGKRKDTNVSPSSYDVVSTS
ncbi:MAG: NAD(P)-dependent oxidoreductase [Bacteriovoracia bacterium]